MTKSKLKAHRAMVVRMAFGTTGKVTLRKLILVVHKTLVIHIVLALVFKTLKNDVLNKGVVTQCFFFF